MTEILVERGGRPAPSPSLIRRDAKGAPFFTRPRSCTRCGGAGGSDKWEHTGWTCYDCGGSGKGKTDETVKLYTPEQVAKLDATQAKRNAKKAAEAEAKRAAEQAEADQRRVAFETAHADVLPWLRGEVAAIAERQGYTAEQGDGFLPDMLRRAEQRAEWTEAQAAGVRSAKAKAEARAAERAASRHVGQPGDRLDLTVTIQRVRDYQRARFNAPWLTETVWIVTMRDEQGNALVSKSTGFHPAEGTTLRIRATVKEHGEYNGEAQTELGRVQDVAEAAKRRADLKAVNAQIAAHRAAEDAAFAMGGGFLFHEPYCGSHRPCATFITVRGSFAGVIVPEVDTWALYRRSDYYTGVFEAAGLREGAFALARGATYSACVAAALTHFAEPEQAVA